MELLWTSALFPTDCDCCGNPFFLMEGDGNMTDEDEGGRELRRDVLLLLELFDMLGVVKDVEQLKPA